MVIKYQIRESLAQAIVDAAKEVIRQDIRNLTKIMDEIKLFDV